MDLFTTDDGGEASDEYFALERCKSRIHEMQTQEYLDQEAYLYKPT